MKNLNPYKQYLLIQIAFIITALAIPLIVSAQEKPAVHFFSKKQRGVGLVTADSTFSLNFQFRMQNRAAVVTESGSDLSPENYEFRVRRLRFKFEGFAVNPKLTYYIQLSVSRGDMDWRGPDNNRINNSPNIVRDAVIYYNPNSKLRLGFGQTKLPGNRQRVVSSGDQQFYDRSIVNARFNIDRDFGFFAHYTLSHFILRGAITSGEGRNAELSNNGLAYTGRLEFLPFGRFTGNNDYVEGDLEREKNFKMSLATTYSFNDLALRQAGQLGSDLYSTRSLNNFEADVLMKYSGWAWYSEYMTRAVDNPITINPANTSQYVAVYDGYGVMSQMSFLFRNNFEVSGRVAMVMPSDKMYNNPQAPNLNEKQVENYELGVTKYLNGHRVKIQGGLVYTKQVIPATNAFFRDSWTGVFQFEIGI